MRKLVWLLMYAFCIIMPWAMPGGKWTDGLFAAAFLFGVPLLILGMWAFLDWLVPKNP